MNRRVQIGILLFLAGAVIFTYWRNKPPPVEETAPVVITRVETATTIPEQVVITDFMVREVPLRPDQLPVGNLPPEWIQTSAEVVGHISRQEIPAGTPLERGMLGGLIADEGLAALVPFGMRAMSVRVFRDGPQAIHDMVRTGDRIDLIASFGASGFTKTIAEGIPVIAVDVFVDDERSIAQRGDFATPRGPQAQARQQQAPPKKSSPTLTLGVTPEQAEIIALVDRAADIEFVVRGRYDSARTYLARSGSRRGKTLAEILPPSITVRPAKKRQRVNAPIVRREVPSWPLASAQQQPTAVASAPEEASSVTQVVNRRLDQTPAVRAPAARSIEIFAPGSRRVIEVPTGSSS